MVMVRRGISGGDGGGSSGWVEGVMGGLRCQW